MARGALYTALERLESKRYLRSRLGEPLAERGGRSRRDFTVTPTGLAATRVAPLAAAAVGRTGRAARIMSRTDPGPPRVAERLLSATLEPGWAERILGDLHEEHGRRAGTSRFAASVWYSRQALRLARATAGARSGAAFASNDHALFPRREETP